jgi:hypothetical protein
MGLTEQIAREAGVAVIAVGALRLVPATDVTAFIDACARGKVRILGVEDFEIRDNKAVPDMDTIADFSEMATSSLRATIEEARRFVLQAGRPDMVFDFTLASEDD